MKQIEIHSYVKEDNLRKPIPCYIYKPNNSAQDKVMAKMGWKRKDLLDENYFFWTESDLCAENTAKRLGVNIATPEVGLILRVDYEPEKPQQDISDKYYQP
jgi:hypothetical protein